MRQRREGVFGDGRRIGIGFFLIYCWYAKIGCIISPKAHPFGPHSIGMEVKADVFELMFSEGGMVVPLSLPSPPTAAVLITGSATNISSPPSSHGLEIYLRA